MDDFDIEKICRVCLQSDQELLFLFDTKYAVGGICLHDMISECTMYTVRRFDGLPDLMCTVCVERVRNAYEFKKQFETSHRMFVSFLGDKYVLDTQPSDANDKSIQTDETSLYPCEKCDEKFVSYERLREHRTVAHRGTAHLCRLCSKTCNRIADLKNHIAICHPEAGYVTSNECTICKKKFTRKDHVVRHMRKVHKTTENMEESKESSENECNEEDNGILKETEIDAIPKPDTGSVDPVCSPKIKRCKQEMETPEESEIAHSLGKKPTLETLSNYEPEDGEGTGCVDLPSVEGLNITQDFIVTVKEEPFDGLNETRAEEETPSENQDSAIERGNARSYDAIGQPNTFKSDVDVKPTLVQYEADLVEHEEDVNTKEESNEFPNGNEVSPVREETAVTENRNESSSNRPFKCNECDKEFMRSNHLRRHVLSHSQEKPFGCDLCDKRFIRSDHLRKHQANHSNDKPFECSLCQKKFARQDYLKTHMSSHGEGDFQCDVCERVFAQACLLKRHKDQVHSGEKKIFMKKYSGDKTFLCSECGQRFVRNVDLTMHMQRHSTESSFKCQYCDKEFLFRTELSLHERYHTGEKLHVCNICDKRFLRPHNLRVHLRTHTGERPYQCPHCPKSFTQCNDLSAHIRRHTGERYRCDQCEKGFIHIFELNQHKKSVHGTGVQSKVRQVAKLPDANIQ